MVDNLLKQSRPIISFLKDFFLMWTIFKVFTESVTVLLQFCFGFLALRYVGSQLPNQGLNLHALHQKAKF